MAALRGMEHCLKSLLSFTLQCATCLLQSNPHFAARLVVSVGCIRVEACTSTLETIFWAVKTFSKSPSPHSWRVLQGFECIPATNLHLNSSGLSLNNPHVVKSASYIAEKEGWCGSHSCSTAVALKCVKLLYSSIVGFLKVKYEVTPCRCNGISRVSTFSCRTIECIWSVGLSVNYFVISCTLTSYILIFSRHNILSWRLSIKITWLYSIIKTSPVMWQSYATAAETVQQFRVMIPFEGSYPATITIECIWSVGLSVKYFVMSFTLRS